MESGDVEEQSPDREPVSPADEAPTPAPAPVSLTQYWQMPDGCVTTQTASPPSAMVAPAGGTEIDAATAQTLLSQLSEAHRQAQVTAATTQAAQAKDDYDALIALGLPQATALRLSQYQGETG